MQPICENSSVAPKADRTALPTALNADSNYAKIAQLVEHNLAKVRVAGSSPVSRSNKNAPVFRRGNFIFNEFRRYDCIGK